ncbi:MAG TPA: hypothetical protein VFH12_00155 [Pseudoxanthomonas sp.]|nr:hypothetical protein [Pseudoxanthomonas sp.]
MPFEALLIDLFPPLIAGLLVDKSKAMPFVQTSGSLQAFEGMQVNATKSLGNAMLHGVFHQSASDSCSARFFGGNEPTKVRAFFLGMRSIYGDGPLYSASFKGQPDSIASSLVLFEEGNQPAGDPRFEAKAKPDKATIVVGVEFGNASDAAGYVSLLYG